jgi:FAD/FMN-containing dehydrogenase
MRLLTGAQGTMGIVVWASVKCELIPTIRKCCFVPGERLEDLVDFCYKLERVRLGDEVFVLNRAELSLLMARGDGSNNTRKEDLPAWVVVIGLAGTALFPEERIAVQEKDLKDLAQSFGLELKASLAGVANAAAMSLFDGFSSEPHWKTKGKGGCQDIFFLSTLDKTPQFISTMQTVAVQHAYSASEIGVYIQPQHHGVSQHVEFSLPYDPSDKREVARIKEISSEASEGLRAQGAYFSRPYGPWAEMVYSHDATAKNVLRTVKQIVDPNNILNPGKLCF